MGFPRFWGRVQAYEQDGDDKRDDLVLIGGEGKRDDDVLPLGMGGGRPKQLGWHWTAAYYELLVSGFVTWLKLLWILTESENALAVFK